MDAGAEATAARVEQLLRAAAEWEPEQPAPEGLATRVLLAGTLGRLERRRGPSARLAFWFAALGGLAGAGACAALALGLVGGTRQVKTTSVTPAAAPTVPAPGAAHQDPAAVSHDASEHADPMPRVRLAANHYRMHRRRKPARLAAAPVVRWQEHTVPVPVAGVLATAWLLESTPDGTLVATPGLVNIPVAADEWNSTPTDEPHSAAPTNPMTSEHPIRTQENPTHDQQSP